jgi:chromosome segregation ATPase
MAEDYETDLKELDQLKEQLEAYKMEAEEGKEINAELKAELEQEKALKETYLACYKAKHEDIEGELFNLKADNDELKDLNTRLDNQRETYWKGYQKLKQTLTEIKKIIHFNKTNRLSGGACISIEQILQKISEVENDM